MSIAKLKSVLRNIGLVVVSTILSLLLAEWSIRTFYPQQLAVRHTTEDGLVIHPPGLTTYLTEFKQEVRFNAMGMRDKDHAKAKPPNTARILVLGDSFMEALQVAFEDSFPSLLELGLRDRLQENVEVINCAVSGWGQDDQLAYLTEIGRAFEPDLILVAMTLHNDVLDNMEERFHTLAHDKLVARPLARRPLLERKILHVKDFFASRSHLAQLLRKWKIRGEIQNAATALDGHVRELISRNGGSVDLQRGWKLTFELFKRIREVGKSMGADTAIILIPLKAQLQEDSLEEFLNSAGMSIDDVVIDKPQQEMKTFGHEANIEIIDLLPTLRKWTMEHRTSEAGASLHLHEGHWNVDGHILAAKSAVDELVRRNLVRIDGPVGPR